MTSSLLITSIEAGIGKTTLTLALALRLKKEGKNVGYFKPITDSADDTDSKVAKETLGMSEPIELVCPATVTPFEYDMTDTQVEAVKKTIMDAYAKLKPNYDFLIIESCRNAHYLEFIGLGTKDLAPMLDAKVMLLAPGGKASRLDRLVCYFHLLKSANVPIVGAVISLVPDQLFQHFQTSLCPRLEKQGIVSLGLIPDRSTLVAPTVELVAAVLNARVLAGKDYLGKLVAEYLVGAMHPEAALKYFRRSIDKAVITGGDRSDIALAAMETSTSALILTGSILPPASVLAKAEERQIPVLSVAADTFTTVKQLTSMKLHGKLHARQAEKLEAWDRIMDQLNWAAILEALQT